MAEAAETTRTQITQKTDAILRRLHPSIEITPVAEKNPESFVRFGVTFDTPLSVDTARISVFAHLHGHLIHPEPFQNKSYCLHRIILQLGRPISPPLKMADSL